MAQHTLQRSEAEETELHSLLKSFAEEDAPALFNDVALVGAPTQNLQPNEVGKATNILDKGISLVRDGHHRKRRKNGPKVGKNVIDALFAEL
ncbi:hypothetical protein FH972_023484 [Carpinus fangiana]|uniref:Uncharacterized protein n=1 Tax=Carpinus fangiana TaxID=176857 RepID=A0A5N6KVK0_9ROSI|nr:hypothetical protein FH972_023484 [Carpinus fangiana]